MKKILINTVLIIGLSALFAVNACKDDIDPVIDELTYSRAFTPIGLKAVISSVTTVTLTWTAVKGTDHYVVEIYQGADFVTANLITTANVGSATLVYNLPSGDTQFTARIKSVSSAEGVAESNWTSVTFKTLPENLFTGYKVTLIGLGSVNVKWKPGVPVTSLLFINNGNQQSFNLTAAEIAAGSKNVTGLTKGSNEIRVMNTSFVRGKQVYPLEGDAILAAGGDLATTIAGLSAGSVLLVESGATFSFAVPLTLSNNIKLRGLEGSSLPTIYATGGNNTAGMFVIGAPDSIVFQNVKISGYINNDNVTANNQYTGIFDQGTALVCAISKIKFNGCQLEHFGRHIIRLRGTVTQTINSFEVNNCLLSDYGGNATSYGLVNANAATASIANIKFTNSTIYNIQCGLIIYNASLGCQSVLVDNCTFDRTMLTTASARYVIDFGTNASSSAGTITISDCVFGQTSNIANGVRNNLMSLSVTGSYYTTDFINVAGIVTNLMTAYTGASTALWTNPAGGIYTFLDSNFAGKNTAGDPRWK